MTSEIFYLVLSTGLCLILWLPYLLERIFNQGLIDTAGYPEKIAAPAKWAQRSKLAHSNMVENLPLFAILIICLNILEISNSNTLLAASLFFYARIIHAVVYTLGIPWVRTLAFVASWLANIILFINIIL
ncbi:MAG: MAPEG family protein [Alphaproteobacteria bacterium]|nr:MAPEG family protein [Alphaproteobacteria bacterium]